MSINTPHSSARPGEELGIRKISEMLALQSGNGNSGEWVAERRNLVDDCRRLFGEEPPDEALVAVMTDSDQTQEAVQA